MVREKQHLSLYEVYEYRLLFMSKFIVNYFFPVYNELSAPDIVSIEQTRQCHIPHTVEHTFHMRINRQPCEQVYIVMPKQ